MKQIIILEKLDAGGMHFRIALWASVPSARQTFYANASFKSAYSGASTQETSDLQAGVVTERVIDVQWPTGTALAKIQSDLIAAWTLFNNDVQNLNPWQRYGTSWDGTSWSAGGVA
jgi:hypothetical protein